MSAARVILITVLVVIVGAALVKGTGDSGDKNPIASVDNGAPRGLLALKLFLDSRGHPVVVRRLHDEPAPAPGSLIIVPPPETAGISDAEADALLAHANAGGALLVLCDDEAPRSARLAPLLKKAGADCFAADVALGDIAPTSSVALLPAFARTLFVRGLGRVRPLPDATTLPALQVGPDVVAVVRVVGEGRIVVLGSATPLTNDGLGQADNAALLLDLVGDRPVVVDERLHRGRGSAVLALAQTRGLGPLALFVGLFLLVPLSLLSLAPRRGELSTRARAGGPPAAAAQAGALAALLSRARR